MTAIPRVVITGVTISGQDIVNKLWGDENFVTIHQVIESLPYNLTAADKRTLTAEAIALLRPA